MVDGYWAWHPMQCKKVVRECGLRVINVIGIDRRDRGWYMRLEDGRGAELSGKEWKKIIDKRGSRYGLNKWKRGMNEKVTLEWYASKECPKYERYYDGSVGSQLLFKARTQSLELNARTYRWNEGGVKRCMMCDLGEDETVMHVVVECDKYDVQRDRFLNVLRNEYEDDRIAEWMEREDKGLRVLLGIESGVNDNVIDAMKEFLEQVCKRREI